jgi:hypothetical protein
MEKRNAVVSFRCPKSYVSAIDELAEQCGEKRSAYMASVLRRHIRAQRLLGRRELDPCNTYPNLLREQLVICEEAGTVDEPEVRSLLYPRLVDASFRLVHGPGSLDGKDAA